LKRHPAPKATILELPDSLDRASAIARREGLGDRLKHRVGGALKDDALCIRLDPEEASSLDGSSTRTQISAVSML
jgi:hypothetical protein